MTGVQTCALPISFPAVAILALAAGANAQIDKLFVTDGDSSRLCMVQGGVVQGVVATQSGAYPIAVSGSVWTGSLYGNSTALEFDLNGNYLGNSVPINQVNAVDGTTDGVQYNYQLNGCFGNSAVVYRSNLDFSNAQPLYNAFGMSRSVGISYDSSDGTIWVSGDVEMRHYDLNGNQIGGWNHQAGDATLAYEESSDTLWLVRSSMYQYDKNGNLLQVLTPNGLAANNWGAEFPIRGIPAPGAAALLGAGGLIAARRRRA